MFSIFNKDSSSGSINVHSSACLCGICCSLAVSGAAIIIRNRDPDLNKGHSRALVLSRCVQRFKISPPSLIIRPDLTLTEVLRTGEPSA